MLEPLLKLGRWSTKSEANMLRMIEARARYQQHAMPLQQRMAERFAILNMPQAGKDGHAAIWRIPFKERLMLNGPLAEDRKVRARLLQTWCEQPIAVLDRPLGHAFDHWRQRQGN